MLKRTGIAVGAVVLVIAGAVGWWLLSPLFISETVNEDFPFSANAQVPESMTPQQVEMVMEGMSMVEQPVEEAMPAMEAPSGPTAVKTGNFRDADSFHKGSGTATVYMVGEDQHVLRLEDFQVTNGPDLRVLLVNHADPQSRDDVEAGGYTELGSLKGNIGNQNYEIPAGFDISTASSVVIYCRPFHVVFSVAPLQEAG